MKESGFSLVEVLLALVLIAIVGTGFLNFFITSSRELMIIDHKLIAHNLARLKLEKYLKKDYNNLVSCSFNNFSEVDYKDYQYQFLVHKIDSNLKRITVVVKDDKEVKAKLITLAAKEN